MSISIIVVFIIIIIIVTNSIYNYFDFLFAYLFHFLLLKFYIIYAPSIGQSQYSYFWIEDVVFLLYYLSFSLSLLHRVSSLYTVLVHPSYPVGRRWEKKGKIIDKPLVNVLFGTLFECRIFKNFSGNRSGLSGG